MKIKSFVITMIVVVLSFAATGQQNSQTKRTLQVGDKAPALAIVKWVKGEAVPEFRKGYIYIIEFGFVSCTPCRKSIPHLTDVAKKYADHATLISVHIWENNWDRNKGNAQDLSYVKRVENFVASMGEKIVYTVAVDVPEQTTADSYMFIGGEKRGAPMCFVVDGEGVISWIGGPSSALDDVISTMISGEFDRSAYTKQQEMKEKEYVQARKRLYNAKENGNYKVAFAGIDSLIAANPEDPGLYFEKYKILENVDDVRADSLVEWMIESENKDFDTFMFYLISSLMDRKNPNYNLAIKTADYVFSRAEQVPSSAYILKNKARAYFKMGDYKKAVETEEEAIRYLKQFGPAYHGDIVELESLLEKYKMKL